MNWTILSENQEIAISNLPGRPDLVFRKGIEAFTVDGTFPFKNGENAMETASATKKTKYEEHARFLRRSMQKVTVEPFVVGTLSSYDQHNSSLTRRIATRFYTKT